MLAAILIFSRDALISGVRKVLKEDRTNFAQETSENLLDNMDMNAGGVSDKVIYDDPDEIAEDGLLKEYEYEDDVDWVKEEWPKKYEKLKSLDWDMENDIWNNENIQHLLSFFYNDMGDDVPGTSYREVPWEAYQSEPEKFYGDRIWYNAVYLNAIEMVEDGDERAEKVNEGKGFTILHTSMEKNDEKEILMYIMKTEKEDTLESFYPQHMIGTRTNIHGWYVGRDESGNPILCLPILGGG